MQLAGRAEAGTALAFTINMAGRLRLALLALSILAGADLLAERPSAQSSPPSFRGGVDLVALDVCVKDRDGRFLPGLAADDFLVLDNNKPQRIEFFSAGGRVPLAVVVLVDRSSSMAGPKLERAKAAATAFIVGLRSDDLLEVMAFGDRADRRLPFSVDRAQAREAIVDLSAEGTTALFDSLAAAIRDLEQARRRKGDVYRQGIIVLSDGADTRSVLGFDDLLEDARRSGVLIYGVSLRADDKGRALPTPRELVQLASDTGGRAVAVAVPEKLALVYEEIGAELRHLYRLAFVPSDALADGSWRRVSVRVPNNADARVRTRAGYYAPKPPARFGPGVERYR